VISRAGGINSVKYFIHNNHLGSVALTTDVNGIVKQGAEYLPYGAPANAQDSKLQPYGFSAKERDASELMYFEARYYDPLSARFISPDPLFAAEMEKCIESIVECNLYQYTGNNPVNFVDPSGLLKFYKQKVGSTTFNLMGLSPQDAVGKIPQAQADFMANPQWKGMQADIAPDGDIVYISTYGDQNKEYFDALKADMGAKVKDAGAVIKTIPHPAAKIVGNGLEKAGLAAEAIYTDDLVGLATKEVVSKMTGAVGQGALKSKVPDATGFQKDAADFLGGQVGDMTHDAVMNAPNEVTPNNQLEQGTQ
jgi:RHS repeat-associated protein